MISSLGNDAPSAALPEDEVLQARDVCRQMGHWTDQGQPLSLRLQREGQSDEAVMIPPTAFRLLKEVLTQMAQGKPVAIVGLDEELTTQQAADLLNVSRPFLVEQLEKNRIPFRKVGTHRRVLFRDVMEFKATMDRNRLSALEELSALDQQLGLGY